MMRHDYTRFRYVFIFVWVLIPTLYSCAPSGELRAIVATRLTADRNTEIRHVQISPDGRYVLYTMTKTERSGGDPYTTSHVYMAHSDGSGFWQVTTGDTYDRYPRWSPDGKRIAFISKHGNFERLSLIRKDGSHIRPLTESRSKIVGFRWSPVGQKIAFVSPEVGSLSGQRKQEGRYGRRPRTTNQLWVIPVVPEQPEIPAPRVLTGDSLHVVFSDQFTAFDWSPDGSHIAFVHRPETENWQLNDISILDVATGVITPLVHTVVGEMTPFYSPDGQWIAYICSVPERTSSTIFDIYLISASGGFPRALAPTPARWPMIIGWHRDGQSIYFTEQYGGETFVESLPVDGASSRLVYRTDRRMKGVATSGARTMVGYTAGQLFKINITSQNQIVPFPNGHPDHNDLIYQNPR